MGRQVLRREGGARRARALPPTVVTLAMLLTTLATAPVRPAPWNAVVAGGAPAGPADGGSAPLTTTVAYTDTGREQRFVVPAGVTRLRVVAVSGRGASSDDAGTVGEGAVVTATLVVTPGLILDVEVGGDGALGNADAPGGFNGGGAGGEGQDYAQGGGGGGASDVRTCAWAAVTCATLGSRLLVAGAAAAVALARTTGALAATAGRLVGAARGAAAAPTLREREGPPASAAPAAPAAPGEPGAPPAPPARLTPARAAARAGPV